MHCIVFANIFLMIALAYYVRHHHLDIKKDNFLNVVQEGGNISLIIAHPDDEDSWNFWDEQHLANVLTDYCSKRNIKLVLTFDKYGVSGHPNHISIYNSARLLSKTKDVKVFTLNSANLIPKYLGFYSLPFILHTKLMTLYKSQFAHYRMLFCLISQYYIKSLEDQLFGMPILIVLTY
ncbi:N-acetylglucosaminyl-phosphatidylinositol de-N-acetylase [Plasmodium brasilianum]|uniref:N-acetylglucosaminyl-phosphatidylinositol de-N-acetylase n=1 Tax=Plasmodium brasilianum TaxID=5824 RepID=A0ACB9Y6B8_PLABR|nr:N-acetylglucosaminyl-phosphatidylinositol de-N-acetylase [Plasmodium brasilianum]